MLILFGNNTWRLLSLITFATALAEEVPMTKVPAAGCLDWCKESCTGLNGNLTFECGLCTDQYLCRPGAYGFDSWEARQAAARRPEEISEATAADAIELLSPPPPSALVQRKEAPSLPIGEPDPPQLLCPTNETLLSSGLQSLPVLKRFCRRGGHACARTNAALAWYLENIHPPGPSIKQTRAALVHRERPRVGAGFAHILQEQAMLLLLGMVVDRPVLLHSEGIVFNKNGALVGPEPRFRSALYRSPGAASAGYSSFLLCRAAKDKASAKVLLPYKCKRADAASGMDDSRTAAITGGEGDNGASLTRWFPMVDDGDAWAVINTLGKGKPPRWNRFTHSARAAPLKDYFPPTPIMFGSPSVIAMYLADFILADETVDVVKRNHRIAATDLAAGRTDLSGPSCLLRTMLAAVSKRVLTAVVNALGPTAPAPGANDEGAILVGVHLRRGDAAMQKECPRCINGEDPDVVDKLERITLDHLRQSLRCVNTSLAAIRDATKRRVLAFVASDTAEGMGLATEVLGEANILSVPGAAVHSTRERASSEHEEGVKVVADFLALALADVHLGLGDSSFLGNAAAAGLGLVKRAGDRVPSGNVCKPLTLEELGLLAEQFARPGAHEGSSKHDVISHVEL